VKQQSGGVGLVTSIPEPISRDFSEINIISLISRLCAKEMPTICVAAGCSNQKDDVPRYIAARDSIFRGRSSGRKEAKEGKGRFCQAEGSEVAAIKALGDMLCALQTRGF